MIKGVQIKPQIWRISLQHIYITRTHNQNTLKLLKINEKQKNDQKKPHLTKKDIQITNKHEKELNFIIY